MSVVRHDVTAKPKARTESPLSIVVMSANAARHAAMIVSTLGGPIRSYIDDGSVGSNSPRFESRWSNSLTAL